MLARLAEALGWRSKKPRTEPPANLPRVATAPIPIQELPPDVVALIVEPTSVHSLARLALGSKYGAGLAEARAMAPELWLRADELLDASHFACIMVMNPRHYTDQAQIKNIHDRVVKALEEVMAPASIMQGRASVSETEQARMSVGQAVSGDPFATLSAAYQINLWSLPRQSYALVHDQLAQLVSAVCLRKTPAQLIAFAVSLKTAAANYWVKEFGDLAGMGGRHSGVKVVQNQWIRVMQTAISTNLLRKKWSPTHVNQLVKKACPGLTATDFRGNPDGLAETEIVHKLQVTVNQGQL